jgi:hypothetical protein
MKLVREKRLAANGRQGLGDASGGGARACGKAAGENGYGKMAQIDGSLGSKSSKRRSMGYPCASDCPIHSAAPVPITRFPMA